jgi:hypothetical protein
MADAPARHLRVAEPPAPWLLGFEAATQGDLPDINVWLALAVQEHPHHAQAQRYWASLHEAGAARAVLVPYLWFCV